MDIIIVGGGLAGLTTYLHLRKHLAEHEIRFITILEKHQPSSVNDAASTFRGGLSVSPNGMRVLRRLDEEVHAEVERAGFICEAVDFRTAGGWRLGTWRAATKQPTKEGMVMIDRKSLWEIIRRRVPDDAIRNGARVKEVQADGSVVMEDGQVLKAHLVVGADGVWSSIRSCIVDEREEGREPMFQSLMNMGGSLPTSYLENLKTPGSPACTMTFGPNGFVGYTPISSIPSQDGSLASQQPGPRSMWWATYSDDPDTASRKTTNFPKDPALRTAFRDRHKGWVDPTINRITTAVTKPDVRSNAGPEDSASSVTVNLHTPTWIIPKLPRWHRGRVILIGDAAHALPSTSGQGASTVLEDSAALALLLASELKSKDGDPSTLSEERLVAVLDRFQRMRKPRVERLLDDAMRMQNSKRKLSSAEAFIMYAVMFVIFRVFGMGDEWKLEYGVEEEMLKLG